MGMSATDEMSVEELLALPKDGLRHEPEGRCRGIRIVDLGGRMVERWRQGDVRPEIVDGLLRFALQVSIRGEIDLPAYFTEVLR